MRIALWSDIHWNANKPDSNNRVKLFFTKLKKEKIDKLIIAGDIATSHVVEIRDFLECLRKTFPGLPIYWVLGNHDIAGDCSWRYSNKLIDHAPKGFNKVHLSLKEIFQYIKDLELEFNIYHLFDDPLIKGDVLIMGFDGWYHSIHPGAITYDAQHPEGVFTETTDRDKLPRSQRGRILCCG